MILFFLIANLNYNIKKHFFFFNFNVVLNNPLLFLSISNHIHLKTILHSKIIFLLTNCELYVHFPFLVSPDVSEKPFEAKLLIFPENKERLKEAPFLSWKKAILQKSLKRSAGNSSRNKV